MSGENGTMVALVVFSHIPFEYNSAVRQMQDFVLVKTGRNFVVRHAIFKH